MRQPQGAKTKLYYGIYLVHQENVVFLNLFVVAYKKYFSGQKYISNFPEIKSEDTFF